MLYTHLHLHAVLTRTNRQSPGTFQKAMVFRNPGALDRKVPSFSLKDYLALSYTTFSEKLNPHFTLMGTHVTENKYSY
jgi:hypothetical protein